MILFVIILSVSFAAYAVWENVFALRVRRERLGKNIRIVHISDLHKRRFGRDNSRISRLTEREKPDIIIVSGDIVSRTETSFDTIRNMLRELCRIAPVYMIFGNHEQSLPPEMQEKLLFAISETDAVLLRNLCCNIEIKGRKTTICGLEESYETYKKNGGYRDLERITPADMERYLGKCPDGEVMLLAHNPFFAQAYSEWGADVVFSGHVHGGVIRLFGIGLLSPERKFFPRYAKGIYTIGKTKLLVSAGLGKLRLFNAPEIVVYEL